MSHFEYSKLKGKIIEVYGSLHDFAEAMGISRQSLYQKLNRNALWNQDQIMKAMTLLNITNMNDAISLFFTRQEPNEKTESHSS